MLVIYNIKTDKIIGRLDMKRPSFLRFADLRTQMQLEYGGLYQVSWRA